uniref:Uncharacterized protein n=1 Tax=Globodera rostochiensis TaxID=31243 RepID=A0A914GR21_GLORO
MGENKALSTAERRKQQKMDEEWVQVGAAGLEQAVIEKKALFPNVPWPSVDWFNVGGSETDRLIGLDVRVIRGKKLVPSSNFKC